MTTTPTNTEGALGFYAQAIRDWQLSQPTKMSDEKLIRSYPALGSTKTFKRILEGNTDELRVDDWLEKYRSTYDQITEEAQAASGQDAIYEDLSPARRVRAAVLRLLQSRSIERLVVVEGNTGSGKSSSLAVVAGLFPGSVTRLDAHEGWRSFAAAMGDLAIAVGVADTSDKLPVSAAARLNAITEKLGEARRIIMIDEGHHMTASVLNALKHLINRTGALFVVAAQSTLWRKLTAATRQEAEQLLKNRLRERVTLGAPGVEDVQLYLSRRCGCELSKRAATHITGECAKDGDFALLRRLGEALLGLPAEDRGDQAATELLVNIKAQLQ